MSGINIYLACIPLAISLFYVIAAVYFPQLYIFGTYEDMYGEWAQAFSFLATGVFSALNLFTPENKRFRLFFAILAVAAFYTFMEEISWGQRLIGFDTPSFFEHHSYQNEANLHNLLTGPVQSLAKTLLTYVMAIGFIGYGIVFPLTLKAHLKLAVLLEKWGLVPPPIALSPAFLLASLFELELFSFNEAEVAELLVAMAMAFTAMTVWLTGNRQSPFKRLAYCIGVTLTIVIASFSTTQVLLNDPLQKPEIINRLANGYEKFADRYEGYDHYSAVVEVLQLYDLIKPDNTVVLRRIADNYQLLHQPEKSIQFLSRAINVGLKRYDQDPNNVPVNISLAKSYHEVNQPQKVKFYADHAYDVALQHYKIDKDKAYWAYWLAKACEQINRQPESLKYYRKAHKLAPENAYYADAYYEKKYLMERYYDEE